MKTLVRQLRLAALASAFATTHTPAFAQDTPASPGVSARAADDAVGTLPDTSDKPEPSTAPDPATAAPADGLWQRATLFGELGGLRTVLGEHGITINLQETSEYLANLRGGTHRLGAYDGLTQATLSADTGKLFGLAGGTFNASALQIHGTNLTSRAIAALQNASGVEADTGTRLWELWYGQSLLGGAADIRIGQQSLDQEFMVSQGASSFVNATFGWPILPSVDLPGGGPAYPLSSPGIRFKAQPSRALTLLAGVYGGYPGGTGGGDAQQANAHGTRFDLHGGALWIGELQYARNAAPAEAPDAAHDGLPGTYKLGIWYVTGPFADPRDGAGGASPDPAAAGNGTARSHRGNYGAYAIADQTLWRSAAQASRSVGVFARVMGAPADRNTIGFSAQAGITLKAPFAGRDNDTAGLALGYTNATLSFGGAGDATTNPRHLDETVIEATYQYQVAPWWTLQGDLQYIVRPGGGYQATPDGAAQPIRNAFVAGVRTVLNF